MATKRKAPPEGVPIVVRLNLQELGNLDRLCRKTDATRTGLLKLLLQQAIDYDNTSADQERAT